MKFDISTPECVVESLWRHSPAERNGTEGKPGRVDWLAIAPCRGTRDGYEFLLFSGEQKTIRTDEYGWVDEFTWRELKMKANFPFRITM